MNTVADTGPRPQNVRQSSINSYYSSATQQQIGSDIDRIEKYLRGKPAGATRRQIAEDLKIMTSSIPRPINALIAAGTIREMQTSAPCPVTRRMVTWVIHKIYDKGQTALGF